MFFAFLLFFSCIGYYTLIFNWSSEPFLIITHMIGIIITFSASITIYTAAEKIKSST